MGYALKADSRIVAVYLIRAFAAVHDHAAETHFVVLRFCPDRSDDAVHGEDRVEIVGCDDQRPLGMLERRGKPATDNVAEHVEDHDIRVFQKVMLLEQLHRLSNDISAAARACGRPARLDAHHAIIALKDIILGAQFLAVELHALKHVDHCRREALCQRERRVVLGVATDLQDALAEMRERCR